MILTKNSTPIIGAVAIVLGLIMSGIYNVQSAIGLDNIGLCIILFTIIIYMLMTPLTIQQQKFSKLQAKMQPELQAIQKKYKGKNSDQAAMAKMNEETQAVYAKYGVNPMGSCLQMVIQLPILFALYRVIWNIPAYVEKVKAVFEGLSTSLLAASGAEAYFSEIAKSVGVSFKEFSANTIIDVLYKFKPANWEDLAAKFPDLTEQITSTRANVNRINTFLGGLDIADSPMNIIRGAWSSKAVLLLIAAILIPVLAAVTQWLNAKLMTNMQGSDDAAKKDEGAVDQMSQTMKSMNTVMPIMSAVFCLSLPVGMGIYWIAGAVVRSIQQIVINKSLNKMDIDELARKNLEKLNEKRAKQGLPPEKMNANAHLSTRNIENSKYGISASKRAQLQKEASEIAPDAGKKTGTAKPGSLAAKANLVREYNESHMKK